MNGTTLSSVAIIEMFFHKIFDSASFSNNILGELPPGNKINFGFKFNDVCNNKEAASAAASLLLQTINFIFFLLIELLFN